MTLHGVRIVSLFMDGKERLCLAQISNTLLKDYSYNEIHNRRVALGITCVQCTPVQVSKITIHFNVLLNKTVLNILVGNSTTSGSDANFISKMWNDNQKRS